MEVVNFPVTRPYLTHCNTYKVFLIVPIEADVSLTWHVEVFFFFLFYLFKQINNVANFFQTLSLT